MRTWSSSGWNGEAGAKAGKGEGSDVKKTTGDRIWRGSVKLVSLRGIEIWEVTDQGSRLAQAKSHIFYSGQSPDPAPARF